MQKEYKVYSIEYNKEQRVSPLCVARYIEKVKRSEGTPKNKKEFRPFKPEITASI